MSRSEGFPAQDTNRPPKGDRSQGFGRFFVFFFAPNHDFCMPPNNLNFGLSEIVEGTFLRSSIFASKFWIFKFSARLPPVEVKLAVFWLHELTFWLSELIFWLCELICWVSELIFWVSELTSLVLGAWTYTFGRQSTKHSEDPWIWKYWRSKHSGMTCESGDTEGLSILVRPVNLEILKDWNLWTSGPFGP